MSVLETDSLSQTISLSKNIDLLSSLNDCKEFWSKLFPKTNDINKIKSFFNDLLVKPYLNHKQLTKNIIKYQGNYARILTNIIYKDNNINNDDNKINNNNEFNLLTLVDDTLCKISSYLDILSLHEFELTNKYICLITRMPQSFHNISFEINSNILNKMPDLCRYSFVKSITFDIAESSFNVNAFETITIHNDIERLNGLLLKMNKMFCKYDTISICNNHSWALLFTMNNNNNLFDIHLKKRINNIILEDLYITLTDKLKDYLVNNFHNITQFTIAGDSQILYKRSKLNIEHDARLQMLMKRINTLNIDDSKDKMDQCILPNVTSLALNNFKYSYFNKKLPYNLLFNNNKLKELCIEWGLNIIGTSYNDSNIEYKYPKLNMLHKFVLSVCMLYKSELLNLSTFVSETKLYEHLKILKIYLTTLDFTQNDDVMNKLCLHIHYLIKSCIKLDQLYLNFTTNGKDIQKNITFIKLLFSALTANNQFSFPGQICIEFEESIYDKNIQNWIDYNSVLKFNDDQILSLNNVFSNIISSKLNKKSNDKTRIIYIMRQEYTEQMLKIINKTGSKWKNTYKYCDSYMKSCFNTCI